MTLLSKLKAKFLVRRARCLYTHEVSVCAGPYNQSVRLWKVHGGPARLNCRENESMVLYTKRRRGSKEDEQSKSNVES